MLNSLIVCAMLLPLLDVDVENQWQHDLLVQLDKRLVNHVL
jgi:hypothetical protein